MSKTPEICPGETQKMYPVNFAGYLRQVNGLEPDFSPNTNGHSTTKPGERPKKTTCKSQLPCLGYSIKSAQSA